MTTDVAGATATAQTVLVWNQFEFARAEARRLVGAEGLAEANEEELVGQIFEYYGELFAEAWERLCEELTRWMRLLNPGGAAWRGRRMDASGTRTPGTFLIEAEDGQGLLEELFGENEGVFTLRRDADALVVEAPAHSPVAACRLTPALALRRYGLRLPAHERRRWRGVLTGANKPTSISPSTHPPSRLPPVRKDVWLPEPVPNTPRTAETSPRLELYFCASAEQHWLELALIDPATGHALAYSEDFRSWREELAVIHEEVEYTVRLRQSEKGSGRRACERRKG